MMKRQTYGKETVAIRKLDIVRVALMAAILFLLCTAVSFAGKSDFSVDDVTVSKDSVNWGDTITVRMDYTCTAAEPQYIGFGFSNKDASITEIKDDIAGDTYSLASDNVRFYVNLPNEQTGNSGYLKESSYDPTTGKGSITVETTIGSRSIVGHYSMGVVQVMHLYEEDNHYRDDFYYSDEWDSIGFDVHSYYGHEAFDKEYLQEDLIESLEGLEIGDIAAVRCRQDIVVNIDEDTGKEMTFRNYRWVQLEKRILDAIKGRNVTLIIPGRAVINGEDIVNETRNVTIGVDIFSMCNDDGTEKQLILRFNDEGELPGKMKYYIGTVKELEAFLNSNNNGEMITLQDILEADGIYHVQSGELVQDDANAIIEGDALWVELTHNSSYVCSKEDSSKLASFKFDLGKTKFTYNGKVQVPQFDVDAIEGTSWTALYDNKKSKNVGKYKVVLKGTGDGYGKRTITYYINPKGTSLSKLKGGKKKITVRWKKQSKQTTGYQIQVATDKKFKKNEKTVKVSNSSKLSKTIKGLKRGKKYYVHVRTYKTVNGTNCCSSWSTTKSVRTK